MSSDKPPLNNYIRIFCGKKGKLPYGIQVLLVSDFVIPANDSLKSNKINRTLQ